MSNPVAEMLATFAKVAGMPKVYPAYIAFQARNALRQTDPKLGPDDQVIAAVSDVETIGDCRYAFTVTDHNSSTYKVTVELQEHAR